MASVYKKARDKKKNGGKGACYYFDYVNQHGKRVTEKGFTDKQKTRDLATKREDEARQRRSRLIDPVQEQLADHRKKPIEVHLKEFEKSLSRKEITVKNIRQTVGRIRRTLNECGFQTLGDLCATKTEEHLSLKRHGKRFGVKTFNHYVSALLQFGNWLIKNQRLTVNPFVTLIRLNNNVDIRRPRRALSQAEFSKLTAAAEKSDTYIQCISGPVRSKLYQLSYYTGLRRSELGSLTPASFNLQSVPPTVTVEATVSKHRRKDVLPLHPSLMNWLPGWLSTFESGEHLFPRIGKRRTSVMVKKDLEAAGIPYKTAAGYADFHAAGRHTYVTGLVKSGVNLVEAKELARHSDVKMTMQYTHIELEDQAKALAKLPEACQHIVSTQAVDNDHRASLVGTNCQGDTDKATNVSDDQLAGCDANSQQKTPEVNPANQWRRRESNPRPATLPCRLLRV